MHRKLIVASSVIAAACASGGMKAEPLSEWAPPVGQECMLLKESETLPAVAAVVDDVALMAALEDALSGQAGHTLFSLRFDTTGVVSRVAAIESDLPLAEQQAMTRALRTHLQTPPPRRTLQLRLDVGDTTRIRVGHGEFCGPALRNSSEISRRMERIAAGFTGQTVAVVKVKVMPDGMPGEVQLVRGSGHLALDTQLKAVAAYMRFHPALEDRIPVVAWAQIPLRLRSRPKE